MRDSSANLLQRRTGRNLDDWNRRIARRPFLNQAALRQWLADQGVTGYPQQLLVWERFGYPSFMTAGADDLIDRQYVDRAQLLVSKRRTFAATQATTSNRVDLGLRLGNQRPGGRLKPGKGVGNGSMTVCLPLSAVADLDDEALSWLRRAYDENA